MTNIPKLGLGTVLMVRITYTGVDGLHSDGFFSEEPKLSYWPAGYPFLLWPLGIISTANSSILLQVSCNLSSLHFRRISSQTSFAIARLRFLAFWTSIFISFNPTLSLSSLAVGYEAPIAACFMMIAGLILCNL
jgi:hypothetical protein